MLADLIRDYLVNTAGVERSKFDEPGLMVSDLGLDSLGLVEMLFEVEDRFGFQIADPSRFQAMSFDEMVEAIEGAVKEHHGGTVPEAIGAAAGAK